MENVSVILSLNIFVNLSMVTLTVELDQEKDLPVLQALLNRMDLKYHIDNEDYVISNAELEGINAGLADLEAGRTYSHDQVKQRIDEKISQLRNG
jgi:predicted transcriptional regulator